LRSLSQKNAGSARRDTKGCPGEANVEFAAKFAQDAAEKTAFKQARNMDKKATKILADSWQELLLLASILAPILATS